MNSRTRDLIFGGTALHLRKIDHHVVQYHYQRLATRKKIIQKLLFSFEGLTSVASTLKSIHTQIERLQHDYLFTVFFQTL